MASTALPLQQLDTTGAFQRGAEGMVSLATLGMQRQAQQQALQEGAIRLNQMQLQQGNEQAQNSALSTNTVTNPDGSVSLNSGGAVSDLYKSGHGTTALGLQSQLATNALALRKTQAEVTKAQLDNAAAHIDLVSKAIQGVMALPPEQRQQAYTTQLSQFQNMGVIQPGEVSPVWSDQDAQRYLAQSLTTKDAITAQQAKLNALETNRHNTTVEAETKRKDDLDANSANKAIAIYGVPVNQRTPEQTAFLTGYEQNNQVTRVDPRVAAAQAQPVQVVPNANNPGVIGYAPAGAAMRAGMMAPGSAPTQAATSTAVSGASGQIGQTLTAFNTAQSHLQQLSKAADDLKNNRFPSLNHLANVYGIDTGQAPPVVFQAVKTALTGEISKAFTGSGATVSEVNQVEKSIDAANSPEQIQKVLAAFNHLLDSKKTALQGQYNQGTKGQANFGPANSPVATHRYDPADGKIKPITP